MKSRTTAALIATTLLAMGTTPMADAIPQGSCLFSPPPAGPDYDPHDGDGACATISGPLTFDAKGLLAVGVGYCYNFVGTLDGLPTDCDNSFGEISGAGAAKFDTINCKAAIGCIYDVWATHVSGMALTGWGIIPCTDRGFLILHACSNVLGDVGDDFGAGYNGLVFSGEEKENKGSDWAHTEFCVRPDVNPKWYDDFFVFITVWMDENIVFSNDNDNFGIGLSLGVYDIFVEYNHDAASLAECLGTHTVSGGSGVVGTHHLTYEMLP